MNNLEKSKEILINEIEKRLSDKVIEKTNADLLVKLINNADSVNEAIQIAELGTTYRRTGLHFDKRLEKMSQLINYFKKDDDLSFTTDKDSILHKLISGDNYLALQNLLIEYRNKIDFIYIDPPYGKDAMGEFALTNYDNALTRDNLLSMLYPRLLLAKQLMSPDGVIFCSIDDRNHPYVKLLFDEIFEEKNQIGPYFWKKTDTPPSLSYNVRKKMEYVLGYTLQYTAGRKFSQGLVDGGDAPLLNGSNPLGTLVFPVGSVKFNIPDGTYENSNKLKIKLLEPVTVTNGVNSTPLIAQGTFKWGQKYLDNELDSGTYLLVKSHIFSMRYQKPEKATKIPSSIISMDEVGVSTNEAGVSELNSLGLNGLIDNPKPTSLIKYLIKMSFWDRNDITILDFFAGSGTTGQAVLELNKEDKGSRKFILSTLNELTDSTPNGIVNDLTSKRLKRVMSGKDYIPETSFEWSKKNEPLGGNLDVYTIESISNFSSVENRTPFDLIDERLYGQNPLNTSDKIAWVCENFEKTQIVLESDCDFNKRLETE